MPLHMDQAETVDGWMKFLQPYAAQAHCSKYSTIWIRERWLPGYLLTEKLEHSIPSFYNQIA